MPKELDIDRILSKAREQEDDVERLVPPLAPREVAEASKQAAAGRALGGKLAARFGEHFSAGLNKP
jgi:hypothetical protein